MNRTFPPLASSGSAGIPGTGGRLALALAISIALHVAIGTHIRAPASPAPPLQPLEATLVAAQKEPPPPLRSKRKVVASSKPRSQPRRTTQPTPAPASIAREAEPGPPVPMEEGPAIEGVSTAATKSAPSLPVVSAPSLAESPQAVTPLRVERPLSPQGTIQFDLYYGANRFLVGRSELSWDIADGRYRLATNGKTVGLAALFYPFGMSSGSEGRITAAGFEPELFRLDRTSRKGEKQFRVAFDREAGVARFSDAEGVREVPLRPSSLDILSLICQLSVARLEPGPMQLNLTNGRKLDTYEIEVGQQEVVETPMGDLRALYVKQLRKQGDEGIEVWLAVDFAYLPVRLRFTDRKGSIAGEQLVTAIQLVRG
jgi:Protein of unknown function (DUF3108)